MRLNPDTVRSIARLARIQLEEGEREELADGLGHILDYMERLRGTELEGADPGSRGVGQVGTREDEPRSPVDREQVLGQAPEREGPWFRVPPVLPPRRPEGEDEA